jgi:hypothetical protein
VTVVSSSGAGFLAMWPADLGQPETNVVSFSPSRVRANNAILALAGDGVGDVFASASSSDGSGIHLIVDVAGYFKSHL